MMVIGKKTIEGGQLGHYLPSVLGWMAGYFRSFTTTVTTIQDVWSSFSIFPPLVLCKLS